MKKSPHPHLKKTSQKHVHKHVLSDTSSLLSSLRPHMKKLRAFTLIELMIAMAIIAILATAGVSAYTGYTKKSRDTARGEMARNLNSSVMSYAASNNGLPPANAAAFDAFVRSAGEVFQGGAVSTENGTLIKDPVGGKDVCLDAAGEANQPCRFDYTAYDDGTYAISYGVEHESSTKENFYKTTNSILANDAEVSDPIIAQTTTPKYGVYIGSAPFIGQASTTSNGNTTTNDDGVDEVPLLTGTTPPAPVYRSIRIDVPSNPPVDPTPSTSEGVTGVIEGGTCSTTSECAEGLVCTGGTCELPGCTQPGDVCLDGTIYVTSTLRTTPNDISSSWMTWGDAMTACENLYFGNSSDWHLPTLAQLNHLYIHRVAIGNFQTGYDVAGVYWSSTSSMEPNIWWQSFYDGRQENFSSSTETNARCVLVP